MHKMFINAPRVGEALNTYTIVVKNLLEVCQMEAQDRDERITFRWILVIYVVRMGGESCHFDIRGGKHWDGLVGW